jgi:hypothetical protein
MSDRLALLVGKIILAWGAFDQHLHTSIHIFETMLRLEPSKDTRFSERKKILRRLAVAFAEDQSFTRRLDDFWRRLGLLERDRGYIAHGWATPDAEGATFRDFPEMLEAKKPRYFTFAELEALHGAIDAALQEAIGLQSEALKRALERKNKRVQLPTHIRQKLARQAQNGSRTPSGTGKRER